MPAVEWSSFDEDQLFYLCEIRSNQEFERTLRSAIAQRVDITRIETQNECNTHSLFHAAANYNNNIVAELLIKLALETDLTFTETD